MTDFFISYQHDSIAFANRLKEVIESNGMPCWMDPQLDGGDRWKEVIDNAIRGSLGVIVVVTPAAQLSQYVTYEWSFGLGLEKEVIPVLLENVENLHPKLSDIQYRNFTDTNGGDWDQLIRDLKKIRDRKHIPAPVASAQYALRSRHKESDWNEALLFLERHPDLSAYETLADETKNPEPVISIQAALILARKSDYIDRRAVPRLCAALSDKIYGQKAATALGKLGGEEALQCLLAAFDTLPQDPVLVRLYAQALADTKEPTAAIKLATLIGAGDIQVQETAIKGLIKLATVDTLPDLFSLIENPHSPLLLRKTALEAVEHLNHREVRQRLRAFLARIQPNETNENLTVFSAVVDLLGRIGDEESLSLLQEIRIGGLYNHLQTQIGNAISDLQQRLAIQKSGT